VAAIGDAPPDAVSVNAEAVIVVASMAVEKLAVTVLATATPVAPLAGTVAATVGAPPAPVPVVKVQLTALASGVPSDAVIVVSSFAVYVVVGASRALGCSVAVLVAASYVTAAATGVVEPAAVSVKLDGVSVDAAIGTENAARTRASVETAVAPSAGTRVVTLGVCSVVNVHVVAVSVVPSVAAIVPASAETFVATGPAAPDAVSVKLDELIVAVFMLFENVAVTVEERGTATAPAAGVVAVTVGAGFAAGAAVVKLQ
jgi:hypothetical protein